MTNRKSKRKIVNNEITMNDVLISKRGGYQYPVDVLKEAYVNSNKPVYLFCHGFGLSPSELKPYIEKYEWDRLREEKYRKVFNTAVKARTESFLSELTTEQRELALKNFQRNQRFEFIEEHLRRFGHLFAVDEDGNVKFDRVTGLPLQLRVGSSKEEILARRELLANVELLTKMVVDDSKNRPQLAGEKETKQLGGSTIDAKEFLNSENDEEEDLDEDE